MCGKFGEFKFTDLTFYNRTRQQDEFDWLPVILNPGRTATYGHIARCQDVCGELWEYQAYTDNAYLFKVDGTEVLIWLIPAIPGIGS